MEPGYFFSDEPGYYEKGKFGIRLETVLVTIEKNDLPYGKWENILHTYAIGKIIMVSLYQQDLHENSILYFSR